MDGHQYLLDVSKKSICHQDNWEFELTSQEMSLQMFGMKIRLVAVRARKLAISILHGD